ncbi:hypothetical protein HanIR_Chr11g0531771 [Helianthus annuus]|nr:hypothetical protein HanIR_Chr11g0531771 [Helianthus annuus]
MERNRNAKSKLVYLESCGGEDPNDGCAKKEGVQVTLDTWRIINRNDRSHIYPLSIC